jgi:hypothetical protein
MQNKTLTSSGAIGTSGANVRVYKVILAGGATLGTLTLKTGGSGGTQVGPILQVQNGTEEINLPGLVCDYATIANCEVLIGFAKGATG